MTNRANKSEELITLSEDAVLDITALYYDKPNILWRRRLMRVMTGYQFMNIMNRRPASEAQVNELLSAVDEDIRQVHRIIHQQLSLPVPEEV